MSYSKQTWQDGTTPVNASHMNHIEDGIAQVEEEAETEVQAEATARENADDGLQTQVDELNDSLDDFSNGTIEIGVRNYMIDSQTMASWTLGKNGNASSLVNSTQDDSALNGYYLNFVLSADATGASAGYYMSSSNLSKVLNTSLLREGETYTFSLQAKTDSGISDVTASANNFVGNVTGVSYSRDRTLTDEWKTFWKTFVRTSSNPNICFYFSNGSGEEAPIYISAVKLQKGSIRTDWCA